MGGGVELGRATKGVPALVPGGAWLVPRGKGIGSLGGIAGIAMVLFREEPAMTRGGVSRRAAAVGILLSGWRGRAILMGAR